MEKKVVDLIKNLQKKYGAAVVNFANKIHSYSERIPSGSLTLDWILGGGLPRGKAIQYTGFDSGGKTMMCTLNAASVIDHGGRVVWVKGEDFDRNWARKLGLAIPAGPGEDPTQVEELLGGLTPIEPDRLIFIQGDNAGQLLETATQTLRSGMFDLIVIDSITSLTAPELIAKPLTDGEHRVRKPVLYTRFIERVYSAMNLHFDLESMEVSTKEGAVSNPACVIYINQLRDKISHISLPPEARGGWALKYAKRADVFFKSVPISEGEKNKARVMKQEIHMKTLASQISPEGRYGSFIVQTEDQEKLLAGTINQGMELVNLGIMLGLVDIAGSWITYSGQKVQGKEKFATLLEENLDLAFKLESQIREKM